MMTVRDLIGLEPLA